MITYQDFQKVGENEIEREEFCLKVINDHKQSADYRTAKEADEYDRRQNTTIMNFRKLLYTVTGEAVPDNYNANYKLPSAFFPRFVTQQNQYLLGNGVFFTDDNGRTDDTIKEKLGRDFDTRLQELGRAALVHKVSFGFWNLDHLEVFKYTEFAPLFDEENGSLRAGVRFWQIDETKPLRFTLYEEDGYTEYIKRDDGCEVLKDKQSYKLKRIGDATDRINGTEIIEGENYPSFPIIPLWGNPHHQSELVGIRESIDCYDLIKSGFANDLDDAASIYWIVKNAGGMDDIDLAQFVERLKTVRATAINSEDGAGAEAHTISVPFEARRVYLDQLRADLYDDFQIVNVTALAAGNRTATEINAAYQPMDNKVDQYEYCVLDFLANLMQLADVVAVPVFKRSKIVNQLEETQMVLMAAQVLDTETILKKLPFLAQDEVDGIIERKIAEQTAIMSANMPIEEPEEVEA